MTTQTSAVWEHFERAIGTDGAYSKCMKCGVELKGHSSSNAKRHLKAVHDLDVYVVDQNTHDSNPSFKQQLEGEVSQLEKQVRVVESVQRKKNKIRRRFGPPARLHLAFRAAVPPPRFVMAKT